MQTNYGEIVCEEFYFLVKNSGEFVHIGENKRKFRHNLHIFSVEKNLSRLWVTRGSESIRRSKQFDPKMLSSGGETFFGCAGKGE